MRRILLVSVAFLLVAGAACANGEAIRYDPSSGVILPARRTAVAVERERLDIEFQPSRTEKNYVRTVQVRAQ
jgi:hypothetical protein